MGNQLCNSTKSNRSRVPPTKAWKKIAGKYVPSLQELSLLQNIDSGKTNFTKMKKQTMHTTKKIGLFGELFVVVTGSVVEWPVVMKSKPLDSDIPALLSKKQQSEQGGEAEIAEIQALATASNVRLSHARELAIVQMEELQQFLPQIYYSISSISEEMFAFIMEYLSNEHFSHLNTADDISGWTTADIKVVLRDMAKIHSLFMDKVEWLSQQSWMDHSHSHDVAIRFCPLWKGTLAKAASKFPEFWTSKVVEMTTEAIDSMDELWKIFDSFPKTLVQNDCNPRNICIRKAATDQSASSDEDTRQMCIYDWELARIDVPQHDLAEFLAFVLPPDETYKLGGD
ncbi:uncharacterized protein [Dysidea avara]|uniref:uncharacterized protein n=1 Tax=Dysidea avara TaxID=196820 RepID=UPI00331BC960